MTATVKYISKTHNAAVVKVVGNVAGDSATIDLVTSLTIGTHGDITFTASGNTIERASGSWISDGVVAGSVITISGAVSNNGSFLVTSVDDALTLTIDGHYPVVDEVAAAATVGGYYSVLTVPGQFTDVAPKVNLGHVKWSVAANGSVSVVRNSSGKYQLGASGEFNGATGDDSDNTSDIVVTFTGGVGTILLELKKVDGFGSVNPVGVQ